MPLTTDPNVLRSLLESLDSGMVAVDARRHVVALSQPGARILDIPDAESAVGRPVDQTLSAHPALRRLLEQALSGRAPQGRAELALEPASGVASTDKSVRRIGFTVAPIWDEAGQISGAILLFRDLTPFERMDEQERLRDRLAALGQMAAGLAHEIRNPLASIELLAGLLKREAPDDPEIQELIAELIGEVHEVAGTVRSTLDFVRPAKPVRERVRLAPILEKVTRRVRGGATDSLAVSVDCPARLCAVVDPGQVHSIASHLVSNASEILRAGAGGEIHVAVAPGPAGGMILRVEDSGPGVPHDLRERIFHPFFTTRSEGTGVGLAEVQKFALAHGGSVDVTDSPLGGARFVVDLPGEDAE